MPPCPRHPNYAGLRLGKSAKQCPGCVAYYHEMRLRGEREQRAPRKAEGGDQDPSQKPKDDPYEKYPHLRDPVKRWLKEQKKRAKHAELFQKGQKVFVLSHNGEAYIVEREPWTVFDGPLDWGAPKYYWLLKPPTKGDLEARAVDKIYPTPYEAMEAVVRINGEIVSQPEFQEEKE